MRMIDRLRNQLQHLIRDYFAPYTDLFLFLGFLVPHLFLLQYRDDANRNKYNNEIIRTLMCARIVFKHCLGSIITAEIIQTTMFIGDKI